MLRDDGRGPLREIRKVGSVMKDLEVEVQRLRGELIQLQRENDELLPRVQKLYDENARLKDWCYRAMRITGRGGCVSTDAHDLHDELEQVDDFRKRRASDIQNRREPPFSESSFVPRVEEAAQ